MPFLIPNHSGKSSIQTAQESCTDVARSGAHQNFYGNPGLRFRFQRKWKV